MADEQLRYKVTADTKGFVNGMKQVQTATQRSVKNTGKQSRAFTQLSYALDDAQYGFRGVQNNLQQIAVQMGLGGPLILGLTALLVVLGRITDNKEKMKAFWTAFIGHTKSAVREAKKLTEELRKHLKFDLTKDQTTIIKAQNALNVENRAIKLLEKKLKINKTLLYINKRGQAVYREITDDEKASIQTQIDLHKENAIYAKIERDDAILRADLIEKALKKEKLLTAQKKKQAEYAKSIAGKDLFGGGKLQLGTGFNTLLGVLPTLSEAGEKFGLGLSNTFSSLGQQIGDFTKGFRNNMSIVSGSFTKVTEDAKKNKEKWAQITAELNASLNGVISGGIANFASIIGESLVFPENVGKNLMSGIGKLMVAFGGALIAWGIGWKYFKDAPKDPTGTIIAGAALIVAGAAISAVASKAASFTGGSGSSTSSPFTASVTPSSVQGSGSGGQLVATVRGQDLRFILQGANDNYTAFN